MNMIVAEELETMVEEIAKQMKDVRAVYVGTRIPTWPKQVGGGEETLNNQSE